MKVHWTDTALGHLQAIHDYIARDSERNAKRFVDRLTRKSQTVGLFPESGSIVPEFESPEIREVFEQSYRIIYNDPRRPHRCRGSHSRNSKTTTSSVTTQQRSL